MQNVDSDQNRRLGTVMLPSHSASGTISLYSVNCESSKLRALANTMTNNGFNRSRFDKILVMIACRHLLGWLLSAFRSRQDLILENLALRQQLLALHAQPPRRRLTTAHKLFWVGMRKVWARWKQPLILVTPRTVVHWHRPGFRLCWKWISRAKPNGGRKPISQEIRGLIFQMLSETPPGVHRAFMASC